MILKTLTEDIIELTPNGVIDRYMSFDEYMTDQKIKDLQSKMWVKY